MFFVSVLLNFVSALFKINYIVEFQFKIMCNARILLFFVFIATS